MAAEARAFLTGGRRPLRRAADEDAQGAGVLREARAARCVTRRFAAIDVGTNSVKLHVGELLDDGEWRTVLDRSEMTRLGEGVAETGRLGEEPIRRTVAAIAELADAARQARSGGDRGRRHGGTSPGRQRGRAARGRPRAGGGRGRGDLGRGGGAALVPGGHRGPAPRRGNARRVRDRRRQLAVHLRRGRPHRRALQPRPRRRAGHRALRARPGGRRGDGEGGAGGDRVQLGRSTAARPSTCWSGSAARSRTSPASSWGSSATSPGASAASCSRPPRSTGRSSSTARVTPRSGGRSAGSSRSAPR